MLVVSLVLLKMIFILGLTKVPFGEYFLFFGGFLSKSKFHFLQLLVSTSNRFLARGQNNRQVDQLAVPYMLFHWLH